MKSLIKNVRVIDPALSLDEVADILIDGQTIAPVSYTHLDVYKRQL